MSTKERVVRLLKNKHMTLEEVCVAIGYDLSKVRGLGVTLGLMHRDGILDRDKRDRYTATSNALAMLREPVLRNVVPPNIGRKSRKAPKCSETIEESLKKLPVKNEVKKRPTLADLHKVDDEFRTGINPLPAPKIMHAKGKPRTKRNT